MDRKYLEELMSSIENSDNYYAMFKYTYESCIKARELVDILFSNEILSDEEFCFFCTRIHTAKINMIKTIKDWTVKRIDESKNDLIRCQIVCSVFDVLFGE